MENRTLVNIVEGQEWLEPLAEGLHHGMHRAYRSLGEAEQPAKDFMNGTWLGHPLHPMLTDVTVGMWLATAVLDGLALVSGRRRLAACSQALLGVGVASSAATAATGLSDWMYLRDHRREVGLSHALLNVGSLLFYGASLALRRGGHHGAGRAVALGGLALATGAAYVGGEMAYTMKVGVNHVPDTKLPEDYVAVADYRELQEGRPQRASADGVPVVLVRRGPRVHALVATCSHLGGPLDKGLVDGDTIVCPWHGSRYSLQTGRAVGGPSPYWQPVLETRIHNGQVEVRAPRSRRQPVSVP